MRTLRNLLAIIGLIAVVAGGGAVLSHLVGDQEF